MKKRARGRTALLSALLAGTSGSLASCEWIVGTGDYAVGEAGADGTMSGADVGNGEIDSGGGMDSTREAAAADGTGRDAMAGDAPEDAAGERRGDASASEGGVDAAGGGGDADAGVPEAEAGVDCGQGIPTGAAFTSLVNTCVFVTSCDPYVLPLQLSDCITNTTLDGAGDGGPFSCLSTITDCNGYYACQGVRLATGSATECSGFASSCSGNVAYDCSGGADGGVPSPGTVTNCALTPGPCQTYTDTLGNSRADCVVVPSCTVPDGGGSQCSGNNIYTCVSTDGGTTGIGYGRNCGQATCVANANDARCSFVGGGLCGAVSSNACNGATLQETCTSPTQQFNYDCSRAGGTCNTDTLGNHGCVSPGCPLSTTCAESCNGTLVTTCVGGAPYTVDCLGYGQFRRCFATTGSSPVAWCVP
jgi:hypothetical protein